MRRRFVALLAAALSSACSTTEVVTPETGAAHLVGSVVGTITARSTGAPLPGVAVSVLLPDGIAAATSDANGHYVLGDLPAGNVHRVRFSKEGFVPMVKDADLSGTAGTPSQDNAMATVDQVLSEATAGVEGFVLAGGGPAPGARVVLDLRGSGYDLVAAVTAGADGAYRLDGLPAMGGASASLAVDPWDEDHDGVADYQPATAWVALYDGLSTRKDFSLYGLAGPGSAAFRVVSSDIEGGTHAADTPILLVFDRELDAAATQVDVYDQTSYRTVAVGWSLDAAGTGLLVAPVGGAPFAEGHFYSVDVDAVAADGSIAWFYDTFVAGAGGSPPGPVTGLAAAPASANWNTRGFTLRWTAVEGADRYEVWIRDTGFNPNFTRLATVGSMPAPAYTLTLPSDFDYYTGDGIQTPFTWGTAVDVAVVPIGVAGASGGVEAATPLRLADTVAPTILSEGQSGSADNAAGAIAADVRIAVTFDEYMDPAVAPSVGLPAGVVLVGFEMDPGLRAGILTVRVPAGVDGTGSLSISDLHDTSGNALAPWSGRLCRQSDLAVNGGFEAGSLTGWTLSPTTTALAPVRVGAPVASGYGAARLGDAYAVGVSGPSTIYQDVAIPADAVAVTVSVSYRGLHFSSYGYGDLDCGLYSTGGSELVSVADVSVVNDPAFVTVTKAGIRGVAGMTVRLQCRAYQYYSYPSQFVVDDLRLIVDQ